MPIFSRSLYIMLLWMLSVTVSSACFDHSIWDGLLRDHVVMTQQGQVSRLDFPALSVKLSYLKSYLSSVTQVTRSQFQGWNRSEQLAFLINAYNALTVERRLRISSLLAQLRAYPPKNAREKMVLMSRIKNQWSVQLIFILSEMMTVKEFEEDWIRKPGLYDEPRVHFALYRGFHEGPALLNRAYDGMQLEQQLEVVTRTFLSNRSRNKLDTVTHTLEVSELFDWYQSDFERGWQGWSSLSQFFVQYRNNLADNPEAEQILADENFQIRFQEFNWAQQ